MQAEPSWPLTSSRPPGLELSQVTNFSDFVFLQPKEHLPIRLALPNLEYHFCEASALSQRRVEMHRVLVLRG